MKKVSTIAFAALLGLATAGVAFAQTPAAPATPAAPTMPAKPAMPAMPAKPATPTAATPAAATDKAALSKKCSADADAKGLHGKARKKFRDQCKAGKS